MAGPGPWPTDALGGSMEPILLDLERECDHTDLVFLGNGPGTTYGRCARCGAILIDHAGRSWVLRPHRGQA